jgi:hypothetical protein
MYYRKTLLYSSVTRANSPGFEYYTATSATIVRTEMFFIAGTLGNRLEKKALGMYHIMYTYIQIDDSKAIDSFLKSRLTSSTVLTI